MYTTKDQFLEKIEQLPLLKKRRLKEIFALYPEFLDISMKNYYKKQLAFEKKETRALENIVSEEENLIGEYEK
jgi:hypothetical protein